MLKTVLWPMMVYFYKLCRGWRIVSLALTPNLLISQYITFNCEVLVFAQQDSRARLRSIRWFRLSHAETHQMYWTPMPWSDVTTLVRSYSCVKGERAFPIRVYSGQTVIKRRDSSPLFIVYDNHLLYSQYTLAVND